MRHQYFRWGWGRRSAGRGSGWVGGQNWVKFGQRSRWMPSNILFMSFDCKVTEFKWIITNKYKSPTYVRRSKNNSIPWMIWCVCVCAIAIIRLIHTDLRHLKFARYAIRDEFYNAPLLFKRFSNPTLIYFIKNEEYEGEFF